MVTRRLTAFCACLVLALLCVPSPAHAEPQISYIREERFTSYVVKPLLIGMDNAFVQDIVNAAIEQDAGYPAYSATLQTLADAQQTGLKVRASGQILGKPDARMIVSLLVEASGRVGPGRPGERSEPLMFDLADGSPITAEALFADIDTAQAKLDSLVKEELMPHMSNYLSAESLLPVPLDKLLLDASGLSLYYDSERLSLLSGRSAALHFHYGEIEPLLKLEEGSLLYGLGIGDMLNAGEQSAERIAQAVTSGSLPGLPVTLGQPIKDILADYPLLNDSEAFPGGKRYELEDARFRSVHLIQLDGDENLSGILSFRQLLYGLQTGKSTRDEAISLLGQPLGSVSLEGSSAENYGLPEGALDSYRFDGSELLLSYDHEGLLRAVWLRQAAQN